MAIHPAIPRMDADFDLARLKVHELQDMDGHDVGERTVIVRLFLDVLTRLHRNAIEDNTFDIAPVIGSDDDLTHALAAF